MKTVTDIKNDTLTSLGQQDNPVGILLEEYLRSTITDIVRNKLVNSQSWPVIKSSSHKNDWGWEDKANEFLLGNEID